MGNLPGFGGIWRTLVGEWEKNLIIFIFVFGLMCGDRARWEIYLVSGECGGRWWDSGKKFNYFYICICIRGRVDGRFTWFRRNMEDAGGRVGKFLIIFIYIFGLMGGDRARWEIYLVSDEYGGRWWDSGKKFNYFYICICIQGRVDGRFTWFRRNMEDTGGRVGK